MIGCNWRADIVFGAQKTARGRALCTVHYFMTGRLWAYRYDEMTLDQLQPVKVFYGVDYAKETN